MGLGRIGPRELILQRKTERTGHALLRWRLYSMGGGSAGNLVGSSDRRSEKGK